MIHSGSFIGTEVPVWDIADNFGDTNLLVTNMAQASDLAKCLGGNSVALMRGHGFAAAARSLIEVVRLSVYLPRNARALMRARAAGRRDQIPVARRDRGPQPGLQPLFGRDLAHLGILGEQGRLRPPADPARRRASARRQKADPQMGGSQSAPLLTLLKPSTVAAYTAAGFWGDETIYHLAARHARATPQASRCATAIAG